MDWIKFDKRNKRYPNERLKNYSSFRMDTTHFLYFPIRFDWLTVVPRAGMKLTAYSNTSKRKVSTEALLNMFRAADPQNTTGFPLVNYDNKGGSKLRFLGEVGVVEDFIDFSGRNLTFCDGNTLPLRHVGMVRCFDRALVADFVKATYRTGRRDIKAGIVYVTTAGPRLETPAEIRAMRNIGCDVVGMTLASEAVLLRELDIPHAAVAYSINWAAGLDEEGVSFLEDESIERLARTILAITLDALEA